MLTEQAADIWEATFCYQSPDLPSVGRWADPLRLYFQFTQIPQGTDEHSVGFRLIFTETLKCPFNHWQGKIPKASFRDSRHTAVFRNNALTQNHEIITFAHYKKHFEIFGFRLHFNKAFQQRRNIQVESRDPNESFSQPPSPGGTYVHEIPVGPQVYQVHQEVSARWD